MTRERTLDDRPVDEFHLLVAPIVVRGGKRSLPTNVRLQLERRFSSDVVHLRDPRLHLTWWQCLLPDNDAVLETTL